MSKRNIWRWRLVNNRRKQEVGGEATTKMQVIAAAEEATTEHGLHGTVTTITSPQGIEFTYRPHERVSGQMVWARS